MTRKTLTASAVRHDHDLWADLADTLDDGDYADARDANEQASVVVSVVYLDYSLPDEFTEMWLDHVRRLNESGWDGDGARDTDELAAAWVSQLAEALDHFESKKA